jgi:hypothetical protein
LLAVAVAGDLDGAGQGQAGESLLGGEDAAEVERLEVEAGGGAVVVVGAELGLDVSGVLITGTFIPSLPRAGPGGWLQRRIRERWVGTGC